ncbi:Oxidoreductase NAD-binding domain family protein [Babesia bovis T2Bo]|uniref:Oxidoreductase FAD/NAD(P)-binding domain-containing protein n=1 Tax=Babesia bovis TaxID=5865 RepID=A7AUC0_BABBO|nr:Oxidoreductase NAD-binding domain family protein [Babesia bovis T2Bo]EDO06531.1 Oxidoreductase NAD-binding domain family protein [Babesia bovis T2Bo]|eukprot:XP_001610099.1 hypothetical protein [Babesia bovis T2Bo]
MEINTDYENVINLYLQGERFFKEKPNSVDTSIELKVTLIKRIPISPTVYIFIFQYPPELEQHFMLHIFAHFEFKGERMLPKVQGQWNGKICQQNDTNQVSRKYTPIYIDQEKKEVHILMRIYRPCEKYPDGGSLTRVIECLIPQDQLTIYPSMFKFSLTQNGALTIGGDKVVEFNHLNLVAGGTGITPYVRYLINNKKIPVNLVYCNKTLKEILLKPLLDKLQERGLLKVKYLVTSEDPEVIRNYKPNNDALVFGKLSIEHCEGFLETKDSFTIACGPPGMVMKAKEITTQLGLPMAC